MRNIYTYRLIRYFPHIRSDEFFNVGLWLRDKDLQERRVYIDEKQGHLEILSKFPSVNQQVLAFFLNVLSKKQMQTHGMIIICVLVKQILWQVSRRLMKLQIFCMMII